MEWFYRNEEIEVGLLTETALHELTASGVTNGENTDFIALGHITQNRRVALVGLLVAATVHCLYNSFLQVQNTLPAIVTTAAFILFYSCLTKFRLIMTSRDP